jgi:HEAT repeat protein
MRLALFTFCSLLTFCAAGFGQAGKKDAKKPDEKPKNEIHDIGGKTLIQWTREFASRDPSKREHAMRMVMMFPAKQAKEAVGPLLKELEKHSATRPIDLSVRISGCVAIGTILSSIPPPEKDDKGKFKSEDEDDIKHVEAAVKLLRSFCKDSQVIVKTRAVQALKQIAMRYPPLVTPALDDANLVADDVHTWEARQAGLETLTMLAMIKAYQSSQKKDKDKPAPPVALPVKVWTTYQKRLDDNSQEVRLTALKSLSQFSQPPATLDKLAPLTKGALLKHIETVAHTDPAPSIRIWGHLTLMTLRHQIDKQQLKPIVDMLEDPEQSLAIRIQAAQALGMIGGQLQVLKKTKADEKPKIEPKIGEGVQKYLFDALVITLRDKNSSLVGVGMHTLAQVDPALAVGPVVDMLRPKNMGLTPEEAKALKAEAAKVLAGIGKQVAADKGNLCAREEVFRALRQTLDDSEVEIVAVGMSAMAHADPRGAVDPVLGILKNRKEHALRAEAAKVLAGISAMLRIQEKPAPTNAEMDLIAALNDREPDVVINSMHALVQMGSKKAIEPLQEMSKAAGQQEGIRLAAAEAVKAIQDLNTPKKKTPEGKRKVAGPR